VVNVARDYCYRRTCCFWIGRLRSARSRRSRFCETVFQFFYWEKFCHFVGLWKSTATPPPNFSLVHHWPRYQVVFFFVRPPQVLLHSRSERLGRSMGPSPSVPSWMRWEDLLVVIWSCLTYVLSLLFIIFCFTFAVLLGVPSHYQKLLCCIFDGKFTTSAGNLSFAPEKSVEIWEFSFREKIFIIFCYRVFPVIFVPLFRSKHACMYAHILTDNSNR
jgi:hypothetical protein